MLSAQVCLQRVLVYTYRVEVQSQTAVAFRLVSDVLKQPEACKLMDVPSTGVHARFPSHALPNLGYTQD